MIGKESYFYFRDEFKELMDGIQLKDDQVSYKDLEYIMMHGK